MKTQLTNYLAEFAREGKVCKVFPDILHKNSTKVSYYL